MIFAKRLALETLSLQYICVMLFSDIIGQEKIKKQLVQMVANGRVPHAHLFVTPKGNGALALAIAYAQYLLCKNTDGENITGNTSCNLKCNKLMHPDLHFVFPVASNAQVKKHPSSDLFLGEWRSFVAKNLYGDLFDWYQHIGIENKQGQIGVDEAESIVKKLSLKAFEGDHKVLIIWMAERMNGATANKLLKLIEEPPEKTIFILITEDENQILDTIKSRCQVLNLLPLTEQDIKTALLKFEHVSENEAEKFAQQADGNWNRALQMAHNQFDDAQFEQWFITWIRTAFRAKGNASVVNQLVDWSQSIAGSGREVQKNFLQYCLQFFRQALLVNYSANELVYLAPQTANFSLEKFAPFVHGANIVEISNELNEAIYHIERNGNARIILLDLSIKLTRLLHQKEAS